MKELDLQQMALKAQLEAFETVVKYLAKRCDAAESYIKHCPCDHDITPEQAKAYQAWQEVVNTNPIK